jgi:hypothetical protein
MTCKCKYSDWTNGQEEALKNILGGDKVCRKILSGKVKVTIEEIKDLLLELIGTIDIPENVNFVAKNMFVVDTSRKAKVKISYLGDNLKAWFLNDGGISKNFIGEQTLRYHKLKKSSVDGPVIAELGGETKAGTTLCEMFSLMEKQKNGEDGVLLNNGYANIFYVQDTAGVLRAVFVGWFDDGWRVNASSVENPCGWDGDYQVFSRNSSALESSDILVQKK